MRCRRDVRHRRIMRALVVACALLILLAVAGRAFAQEGDPVAAADQAVAEAQAEVDGVASAYFDALERTRQLEARISEAQQRIDELRQRVAELKRITSDRAVAAYKRSGTSLEVLFLDDPAAADTLRRIKVLDLMNAHDDDVVRALRGSQDELSDELRALDTAREKQKNAVARLREQGRQVSAKLVEAQDRRQVAIEQQLEAQRQAEAQRQVEAQRQAEAAAAAAAAAAAEAAKPPPTTAPPPPQPAQPRNAAPAPVPAGSAPRSGVHPQHNHPYLTCIRSYESTNNYRAFNPAGPAYGAYQFLQPTWNLAANHAGRGDLVGLDPRRASEYDQDDMAWTLYQWQGKRPWSVDPC